MRNIIWILFFGWTATVSAQNSILEKKISLSFTQLKTDAVLRLIEQKTSARFSYNADMFDDSTVSGSFENETVQVILESLLGNRYAYRVKGNYIIIKSTREIAEKNEKFVYTISGYIRDNSTGEIIPFASIYDSATLNGTLSNEMGYYELNIERKPEEITNIGVSKADYKDTFIIVKPIENRNLTISLNKRDAESPVVAVDTGRSNLDKDALLKALTNAKQRWQSSNFRQNFNKDWQVSFVPFMGTNGAMSGAITNRFSLNIIGGYAGGINGLELGGVFNIDRDTSSGAQFAGVYNLTAGPFRGGQFAGVLNNHFSDFSGGQFAGVMNTCSGNFTGAQVGGVLNFARRDIRGFQAAGVLNYANLVQGTQVAGVINTASRVDGVQIAGIVNTAGTVNGSQIGFINVADTVRGLQIGFLSFCKTGVHQAEYSYNDVLQHNFTLRTGSNQFYNILTGGYHPYSQEAWGLGYGVGSKLKLGKASALHFELTGTAFYLGLWDDINSLFRFSVHHELTLFKTVSLIAGPDFNFYYTNGLGSPLPGYKEDISYIKPIRTFDFNQGRQGLAWVGFHVGIGLN